MGLESSCFLPAATRETQNRLKEAIKAQQDEAQLATSVTPSTHPKQIARGGGGGGYGGRDRGEQKSPVTH